MLASRRMKDSLARPPPYEEELRIAVAEGLVSEADAPALEQEARRVGKSPLALLHARGRISDATLAALLPRNAAALEALTMAPLTPASSPSQAAPPFPLPRWDRYQGLRFLGQGGMGQVFLAYDPRLRRDVALKFMKGEDPDVLRRLLTEARAQARVHDERVCPVHEVGEAEGRAFIAMRYIPGRTLGQLAGTLTVAQQVRLVRDATLGVHAAHLAGLIHRDLKPGNILVERTPDGRLHPYVMDFGLAHDWTARGATATGSVLGTPPYMSPEQARGEVGQLDRRADVYSLGATLYHLLTGQPPIPGANGLEVLSRIATVEPVPPRTLRPDVPADLEAIVLKCLEKDRAARYDSALALAEDLDRFIEDRPVLARPVGLGSRLRKKARRHRVAVGAAAIALVAVLGALVQVQLTRRQASHREFLSRRFTEAVERVEAQVRYTGMARLHDVRAERAELRRRLEVLAGDVAREGEDARGPGLYALGRGTLALGDPAKAREQLEAAWEAGFHEPRLAWALALALGQLYRDALLDVENIQDPERRRSRLAETQRRYRDPALLWLHRSEGAEVPSPDYVAALLAFHEDRWDDALARMDAAGPLPPWFFEAPMLRGDILQARAHQRWNQGDRDGARADLDAGRQVLASAAATGESLPEVQLALARLEYRSLVMALYGRGTWRRPPRGGWRRSRARSRPTWTARRPTPGRPASTTGGPRTPCAGARIQRPHSSKPSPPPARCWPRGPVTRGPARSWRRACCARPARNRAGACLRTHRSRVPWKRSTASTRASRTTKSPPRAASSSASGRTPTRSGARHPRSIRPWPSRPTGRQSNWTPRCRMCGSTWASST